VALAALGTTQLNTSRSADDHCSVESHSCGGDFNLSSREAPHLTVE